jgi:hypothetical protein
MSDLVERTARAMYPSWWETIDTCTDGAGCDSCPLDRAHSLGKARAAIKAVAEWIAEDCKPLFNGEKKVLAASDELMGEIAKRLLKQLEGSE